MIDAIMEGRVPPKSKISTLLPRLCAAAHIIEQVIPALLDGREPVYTEEIPEIIIDRMMYFCEHVEGQKAIFLKVCITQFMQLDF